MEESFQAIATREAAIGKLRINATRALDGDITTVAGESKLAVSDTADSRFLGVFVGTGANSNAATLAGFKTRATSDNANTIVVSGDDVLQLVGYGADGSAYRPVADLLIEVDGTPGASDMPGRMLLRTTADGAATMTERVRINAAGYVNIGAEAALDADVTGTFEPKLSVVTNDAQDTLSLIQYDADGAGAVLNFVKTRSASKTCDANTIVANGDNIGEIKFFGADGAAYKIAAQILAEVDGTPGVGDMPGRLVFSTTADGASTVTERLRIDAAGDLTLADGSDFIFNATTGTKLGTATTQKLGFWNTTPATQPAAQADASGGATIDAEARTAINGLLAKLRTIGIIAT